MVVAAVVEDDDEGKLELPVEEGVSKSLKNSSSFSVAVVVAAVVEDDDEGKLEGVSKSLKNSSSFSVVMASVEEGVSNSKKNCSSSMVDDDNCSSSSSGEAKLARVVTATLVD